MAIRDSSKYQSPVVQVVIVVYKWRYRYNKRLWKENILLHSFNTNNLQTALGAIWTLTKIYDGTKSRTNLSFNLITDWNIIHCDPYPILFTSTLVIKRIFDRKTYNEIIGGYKIWICTFFVCCCLYRRAKNLIFQSSNFLMVNQGFSPIFPLKFT